MVNVVTLSTTYRLDVQRITQSASATSRAGAGPRLIVAYMQRHAPYSGAQLAGCEELLRYALKGMSLHIYIYIYIYVCGCVLETFWGHTVAMGYHYIYIYIM